MNFRGFKAPEPATLALYIVLGIAVFVILFFLFRLINCWYFKINHRLKEQQRTNELLEELNHKLDMIYAAPAHGHNGQAAPKQKTDFSSEFAQDFTPAQPPVPPSAPGTDYEVPVGKQNTDDTLLMGSASSPAKPVNADSDTGIPLDEIGNYGPAFCPSCHLPLTKDTVYCPNCGRKVR